MAYIATQTVWITWHQVWLEEGMIVYGDELDPDELANRVDRGVLVSEDRELPVPEPLPVEVVAEDVVADEPEEPAPPRVRRGHE